ncbi:alpha/beta fold hydrolase [Acidisoma silvae]|uniref:Alpha/beta hydrolase n=1 Tax=Acidisoma silvae TaxID=2802396 RepID=A0A963YVU1_9PROT|nr:alpha/beta hydrolase [Acidisoma silvae]MCB8877856.1 alpha/beta hydrolase [Acidisoma silvae]
MASILLIHGLFGSLSAPGILSAFRDVRVLAPDLIGYGSCREGAPDGWTLHEQADHVAAWLRERKAGPVHVVGHSVGGAIAVLFAGRHPELTRSLTSVEGNFTLTDAFWSQKISTQPVSEIEEEVDRFRADAAAWIGRSGVAPTPFAVATAALWLDNQPASTLRSQARAVVAATAEDAYLNGVRDLVESGLPIHLVAGARSRSSWDVPDWLSFRAATDTNIPNTGHLMMLEKPELFAQVLCRNLVV